MKSILMPAFVVIAIGILCILLWVPEWMANQYPLEAKDWAGQVVANRSMLVNLLGGLAVAVTIYFTYGNFKIAQENIKLTQDRSITDTFSKAIEQLGSADMSVRLGGIHSLARIAKSSQADCFPVMQVLTGFLRNKYRAPVDHIADIATLPGSSNCPVEVQSILTIVGERYWPNPDGYELDLSAIEISDAWVPYAKFQNVYFWYVKLADCNFAGAKLNNADFKGAVLTGCDFTGADLSNANFEVADIITPVGLTKGQLDSARNVASTLYQLV
jgi:hypothetical protein